jgi:hypothetical protein
MGLEFSPSVGLVSQEQSAPLTRDEPTGSFQDDVQHFVEVERGGQRFGGIDEKGEFSDFSFELGSEGGDLSLQMRGGPVKVTGPETD